MKRLSIVLFAVLFASKLVIGQIGTQNENLFIVNSSKQRFMNHTELNVGFGLSDTNPDFAKRFIGLNSVLGYRITKNLQGGIGLGLSFYNGGMLVPLFLDLRYIINFGKISAYALGDGGLLFNFSESNNKNRILLNPGVGIKYPIGDKLSANLGAGLFMQTTKEKERDSFVNIKMGMTYLFKNK